MRFMRIYPYCLFAYIHTGLWVERIQYVHTYYLLHTHQKIYNEAVQEPLMQSPLQHTVYSGYLGIEIILRLLLLLLLLGEPRGDLFGKLRHRLRLNLLM